MVLNALYKGSHLIPAVTVYEIGAIVIPVLQMGRLRLRECE